MIPKVNRWIKGVWDDPEEPITYEVLHARQSVFTGRGRRVPDSYKLTRMTMKTYGKQMFIGYCHGERLLYYDVCTPDEQWTRHAAADISMLDVPQYSIDEEWRIFTRGAAYNAAFTAKPREIIMVKNERGWELVHPHLNNPASMLASLKRTNEGIDTTGLKFKVYKKQNIGGWGFGWIVSATHWETVWPDKMDEVRHVLTSQYRSLFDLERLVRQGSKSDFI